MIIIESYLQSEQAREDMRALLADLSGRKRKDGGLKPEDKASLTIDGDAFLAVDMLDAWNRVHLASRRNDNLGWRTVAKVYYRPEGGGFMVTDLGEGRRALRLRTTADLLATKTLIQQLAIQLPFDGPWLCLGDEIADISEPTAERLPESLCRVLLASYRVANLSLEKATP